MWVNINHMPLQKQVPPSTAYLLLHHNTVSSSITTINKKHRGRSPTSESQQPREARPRHTPPQIDRPSAAPVPSAPPTQSLFLSRELFTLTEEYKRPQRPFHRPKTPSNNRPNQPRNSKDFHCLFPDSALGHLFSIPEHPIASTIQIVPKIPKTLYKNILRLSVTGWALPEDHAPLPTYTETTNILKHLIETRSKNPREQARALFSQDNTQKQQTQLTNPPRPPRENHGCQSLDMHPTQSQNKNVNTYHSKTQDHNNRHKVWPARGQMMQPPPKCFYSSKHHATSTTWSGNRSNCKRLYHQQYKCWRLS